MMTIQQVSFRDFVRGSVPADILQLFDRKSKKSKGLYISPEYADEVLSIIEHREKERREKRADEFLEFAGMLGNIEDPNRSYGEIKASKHE